MPKNIHVKEKNVLVEVLKNYTKTIGEYRNMYCNF